MTNVLSNRGWLAAFAAAILFLAAAFTAVSGAQAAGSVSKLAAGSATVAPGGSVTVSITISGSAVGALGVNVAYNPALVSVTACTSVYGSCDTTSDTLANAVYINGAQLSGGGISGTDVSVGTITFAAGQTTGTSPLTVTVTSLADTDTANLTVTPTNGQIVIATVTASPTASPTAAPTATPKTLPVTGGPTDGPASASSMLTWLLVAAGLVVVSGGAWAISRARREI